MENSGLVNLVRPKRLIIKYEGTIRMWNWMRGKQVTKDWLNRKEAGRKKKMKRYEKQMKTKKDMPNMNNKEKYYERKKWKRNINEDRYINE